MVKRKIIFVFFILVLSNLFAEVKTGIKSDLISGWLHMDEINYWYSSATTTVKFETKASANVKGFVDVDVSAMTIPETDYLTSGIIGSINLKKAYAKFRTPWINDSYLRFSIGKMPLSWGYGIYYNAADVIFGFDPEELFSSSEKLISFTNIKNKFTNEVIDSNLLSVNSISAISDYRTMTDWMGVMTVPLSSSFSIDVIGLPPVDVVANSEYGRFGGRFLYQPFWKIIESLEAGIVTQGDVEKTRMFFALDGILWFDYNLCTSGLLESSNEETKFDADEWVVSFCLSKSFTIQTDVSEHSLSTRVESLYYPYCEKINIFGTIGYNPTSSTNVSATCIGKIFYDNSENENSCNCSLCFSWTGIQGLNISLYGIVDYINPDNSTAIVANISYTY